MSLAIAVAGAGLIGRRHIELIQQSNECHLAAIIDPIDAARQFAHQLQVPYFASVDALLNASSQGKLLLDGLIIGTPNQLHAEQAIKSLAANVPVLIEKPVTDSLASGLKLLEAVEKSSVPAIVGHHRLHSATMAKAVEIVKSGQLGRIVGIMGSGQFYKAENEGYFSDAPWRTQPGGGPIMINMIHEIGNFRALCGEIVEVQAITSNSTRGFAVEDTAAIIFRFESGTLGTFLLSDTAASTRSWEQTSGEDPRYKNSSDRSDECYLITGTMGSLSVPTMRMKQFPNAAGQSWHKPLNVSTQHFTEVDPMEQQLAHFCRVIRDKEKPIVSVRDGVNNLRVIDAIAQAARSGSRVRLA